MSHAHHGPSQALESVLFSPTNSHPPPCASSPLLASDAPHTHHPLRRHPSPPMLGPHRNDDLLLAGCPDVGHFQHPPCASDERTTIVFEGQLESGESGPCWSCSCKRGAEDGQEEEVGLGACRDALCTSCWYRLLRHGMGRVAQSRTWRMLDATLPLTLPSSLSSLPPFLHIIIFFIFMGFYTLCVCVVVFLPRVGSGYTLGRMDPKRLENVVVT